MTNQTQCQSVLEVRPRSLIFALCAWLVVPFFSECERAIEAADPEFIKRAATRDNSAFAAEEDGLSPSISPDGRYTAISDANELVVRQQSDGKELLRVANEGMEFTRAKPTFSQDSEFVAAHSMLINSNEGTDGIIDRLIVYEISSGKKIFESNLSVHPEVVLFARGWILVAGERRRNERGYSCQIIRSDSGREAANLIIPIASGLVVEYLHIKGLEFDDTYLHMHATTNLGGFLVGQSPQSRITYSWNWQRVMELSQQGENIVVNNSKLDLVYKRNNQADGRGELARLGATVAPYYVRVPPGKVGDGANREMRSDESGEMHIYEEDPSGGLSIYLYDVSLSDGELVELLKKVPRVKELNFSHHQFNDLSQLSQIKGLEVITTRRTLYRNDFEAIAKLVSLKSVPSRIEDDDALAYISTMSSLESLTLATQKVTDTGVDRISRMPSLKTVYLVETAISSQGLKKLEAMPKLDSVNINFGVGANDQALKLLVGSQKIRKLVLGIFNVAPSRISDAGLKSIGSVVNLESLDLNFIPITDVGVEHLLDLNKLQVLSLRGTKITNAAIKSLRRLPMLANLDISYCANLTDAGLLQVQNLENLQMLKVSYAGSGITKEGVAELRRQRSNLIVSTGTEF